MKKRICAVLLVCFMSSLSYAENQKNSQGNSENEILAQAEAAIKNKFGSTVVIKRITEANETFLLVQDNPMPQTQNQVAKNTERNEDAGSTRTMAAVPYLPPPTYREPTASDRINTPAPPKAEPPYMRRLDEIRDAVGKIPVSGSVHVDKRGNVDGVKVNVKGRF